MGEIVDWLNFGWAVLVAIPGIIAFWWTRVDRAERQRAEGPYGEWRFLPVPNAEGWFDTEISIKNRWDEPLRGTRIQLKGLRGAEFGIFQPSKDFSAAIEPIGSVQDVSWTFWSSSRTGDGPSSGATSLYVRPPQKIWEEFVQSGSGASQAALKKMSRLRIEVSLISASKRSALCSIQMQWSKRPPRRRKQEPTSVHIST